MSPADERRRGRCGHRSTRTASRGRFAARRACVLRVCRRPIASRTRVRTRRARTSLATVLVGRSVSRGSAQWWLLGRGPDESCRRFRTAGAGRCFRGRPNAGGHPAAPGQRRGMDGCGAWSSARRGNRGHAGVERRDVERARSRPWWPFRRSSLELERSRAAHRAESEPTPHPRISMRKERPSASPSPNALIRGGTQRRPCSSS